MAGKVKKSEFKSEDLNLVPIMNLVTILIPFLLMAAQFVHLVVIDSSLPAIGVPKEVDQVEEEEDKLTLTVGITDLGFTIGGAEALLGNPEVPEGEEPGPTIPMLTDRARCDEIVCAGKQDCEPPSTCYDYPRLQELIVQIKDRRPDEENVILVPEPEVEYEWLVRVMDTTRDIIEEEGEGSGEGTGPERRDLFPFVVLAGGTR